MSHEILPRTMVLDEFLPHLDTVFTLHCEPRDAQIRLVEAYPMKDHARLERPPFILIFHSDPMTLLLEGLYVLRAPGFDPAAVHIMTVGAPPGSAPGHYYQAVFN